MGFGCRTEEYRKPRQTAEMQEGIGHRQGKRRWGWKGIKMELMGEEVKDLPPYILLILAARYKNRDASHLYQKKSLGNSRGMGQYYLPAPGKVVTQSHKPRPANFAHFALALTQIKNQEAIFHTESKLRLSEICSNIRLMEKLSEKHHEKEPLNT